MNEKTRKRLTEQDLLGRLAKKHPAPAWAFFTQVRNATGFSRKVRTADAIAMSLWPSRGLELHGFEVKSHRSDWTRELKNPKKAEEIARFCHRWWVVAENDVVELPEIPPSWGLMVPKALSLTVLKHAERTDVQEPTYGFLASLLRNAADSMVPRACIKSEVDDAYKRGREAAGWQEKHHKATAERLEGIIAEFEKQSGVQLSRFGMNGRTAAAVRFVQKVGPDAIAAQVKASRDRLAGVVEGMDKLLAEYEEGA